MNNGRVEPAVIPWAFVLAVLNVVLLWGILWLWYFTVAWSQNPLSPALPITIVAIVFVEFIMGILLIRVKVAKSKFIQLGKILVYGFVVTIIMSVIIILQLLMAYWFGS